VGREFCLDAWGNPSLPAETNQLYFLIRKVGRRLGKGLSWGIIEVGNGEVGSVDPNARKLIAIPLQEVRKIHEWAWGTGHLKESVIEQMDRKRGGGS